MRATVCLLIVFSRTGPVQRAFTSTCALMIGATFQTETPAGPQAGYSPRGSRPSASRSSTRICLSSAFLPIYSRPLPSRQTDLHNPQTIIIFASAEDSGFLFTDSKLTIYTAGFVAKHLPWLTALRLAPEPEELFDFGKTTKKK